MSNIHPIRTFILLLSASFLLTTSLQADPPKNKGNSPFFLSHQFSMGDRNGAISKPPEFDLNRIYALELNEEMFRTSI